MKMALPLYESQDWHQRLNRAVAAGAHPGLLFDKFVEGWSEDWCSVPDGAKAGFLNCILHRTNDAETSIRAGLERAHLAREALLEHLMENGVKGEWRAFETEWRFVSGLGAGHPFETGFIWHRTLGVPYLPGSSVKGMMRAWATQWMAGAEQRENQQRVERLFGPEKVSGDGGDTGAFIAFDALPAEPPELELDILNPHYQPYYQEPAKYPPADYHNPVPVFFLTVGSGQSFRFALAPRPGAGITGGEMAWLWEILSEALENLGAGGKTAVGYGTMSNPKGLAEKWLENALEELRNDPDYRNHEEKDLWKKGLSKKFLLAPERLKPMILETIKAQWAAFGFNWSNPQNRSERQAKRNYEPD